MTDEERVLSCQREIRRLRSVVREYEEESLKFEQYAKITAYVSKIAKELFSQKINLEEVQQYLQEEQQRTPWYLCKGALSISNIINYLKMDLRNEQYRRNR